MNKALVDEASAVFFRSADAFQALMVDVRDGLDIAVLRCISERRFWPEMMGLYMVRFLSMEGGAWSFAGGSRPSVLELAQIYDGTWTGKK